MSTNAKEVIGMVLLFLFCTFCVGACTYIRIKGF